MIDLQTGEIIKTPSLELLDNLYYADLQLRNALNSVFLAELSNSKEIKSFLISSQFLIKLARNQIPSKIL